MDNSKVLTQQDILRFRDEIKAQQGFYDPKVHAHLFSQSVYRHLDTKFQTLGLIDPSQLKREVIAQTLIQGKNEVTLYDLKSCCEALAIPVPEPLESLKRHKIPKHHLAILMIISVVILTLAIRPPKKVALPIAIDTPVTLYTNTFFNTPNAFPYKEIDHRAFMTYLSQKRNGLIGDPKNYYKVIIMAKEHDLDALLLFAIIGQEQNFVLRDQTDATKILNNPFNVYHSWEDYNTNLSESTLIAINTIKNRLKTCPDESDPIIWLNKTYAEDPNWYKGVTSFYTYFSTHFLVSDDEHRIPPILNRVQ